MTRLKTLLTSASLFAALGVTGAMAEVTVLGWPGGPVVAAGIDLDLSPGRRLAVVGPSGIGKTTLLLTLAGLIEPRAGRLTIDDGEPWAAPRTQTASRISLTAEDAHVFATTVFENIRVADPDTTRERATRLLGQAGLGPWLSRLPAGLDTLLGSGGTTVSGGERRRLLLAFGDHTQRRSRNPDC